MLKLASISKRFGGLSVLQDVNIEVPQGSIFGLIGPNGAGKTTVFNLITGLLAPTGGTLTFNGENLVGKKPHQITQMGIARTFQNIRIFKEMTLLENVVVGMHRHLDYGAPGLLFSLPKYRAAERRARDRALELLSWVKLDHKAHDTADNLSYGDQRKLELARALATEPKLLLLDEHTAALDPRAEAQVMTLTDRLVRQLGSTALMVTHNLDQALHYGDRLVMLQDGKIVRDWSAEERRHLNADALRQLYTAAKVK